MPYGDRTGPWGAGPMTGRGAGFCGGFDGPGFANPWGGRMGFGRGWGGGRGAGPGGFGRGAGFGRRFAGGGWMGWSVPWPRAAEDERAYLEQEAEALRNRLDAISHRIDSLNPSKD